MLITNRTLKGNLYLKHRHFLLHSFPTSEQAGIHALNAEDFGLTPVFAVMSRVQRIRCFCTQAHLKHACM